METLKRQVRRAHRRLTWQRFWSALVWCWFGTLLAAAVMIAVQKYLPMPVPLWTWPAVAVGLGIVLAGGWTWFTRRKELEAAIEIDRRFGLKERVSSVYSLTEQERESDAGRALIEDAIRRIERIEVSEQFRIQWGRKTLLPLAPAAIAFLLAMFLNPDLTNTAQATTTTQAEHKKIKREAEILRKKMLERKIEARDKGLKDAETVMTKLEESTRKLASGEQTDRKKALVELNDLTKDLQKKRQDASAGEKLKNQLNQLKDLKQKGPADNLAKAMKEGDFKKAAEELQKLKDQIAKGDLDPKAKEQLAKQLDDMQKKLQQAADKQQDMKKELEKKIAEKRAGGQGKEADELEKQLAKLAEQMPQNQALEKMAENLGKVAEDMKNGNMKQAQEGLEAMAQQMKAMEKQMAEMQMLDEVMDEIAKCKDGMCEGGGMKDGKFDPKISHNKGKGGLGRGAGDRPEEKDKTKTYNTAAKQNLGKGAAVVTDLVDGPNIKGDVRQEIQTEFADAAAREEADPLSDQRLPRSYRDHAKSYFDSIREGEK